MSSLDNTSLKFVCSIVLAVSIFSNLVYSETGFHVQIVGEDVNVYRDVNQSLSLNCTTTSNSVPIAPISWKVNGRFVNATLSSDRWSILLIKRLSRSDAGYYECTGINHRDQQTSSVYVNIKGKPMIFKSGESKLFTRSPVWPYDDETPTLHCFATGSKVITFRWLKNGKELKKSDFSPYRFIKRQNGYSLQMFYFLFKEANFTCEAKNEYGMDDYTIRVSVKKKVPGPVETRAERSVVSSNIGQTSELVCNGKNIKRIYTDTAWFFKGKKLTVEQIKKSNRLHSENVFDRSKMTLRMALTINQTSLADAGNYTCQVTYFQDTINKTIVLAVKGKGRRGDKNGLTTPKLIGLIIGVILVVIVPLILVFCYIKRRKKIDYPPIPEGPFEYGAFITYNSQDFHWVEANLLPLLEANEIHLCIHYRNFEPGVAVEENMVNSVYKSRVVIVVMSNNYMKSKYCRAELDYAMHRALEEHGTNPLIILQIDPTIQRSKLPRVIKNKTYLDLTSDVEKATWETRLLKYVKWIGNDENDNKQEIKEEYDPLIKQRHEEKKKTSGVV